MAGIYGIHRQHLVLRNRHADERIRGGAREYRTPLPRDPWGGDGEV